jgi:hypothetical protein
VTLLPALAKSVLPVTAIFTWSEAEQPNESVTTKVNVADEPKCDTYGFGTLSEETPVGGDQRYVYGPVPPLADGEPPILTLSALHATRDSSGPALAVGA